MEEIKDDEVTIYRTSDINFAAYLGTLDIPMVNTEKVSAGEGREKVMFVFKVPSNALRQLKTQYYSNTGTVKARAFVEQWRNLKSMCFT
jgi:hypothetical protein